MTEKINVRLYEDNGDTILVFKNTTPEITKVISTLITSVSNAEIKEVEHLAPAPIATDTPPELPAFMQEATATNPEDYRIKGIRKYSKSSKTLKEIYATDPGWLQWIAANYTPSSEQTKADLEAIQAFMKK